MGLCAPGRVLQQRGHVLARPGCRRRSVPAAIGNERRVRAPPHSRVPCGRRCARPHLRGRARTASAPGGVRQDTQVRCEAGAGARLRAHARGWGAFRRMLPRRRRVRSPGAPGDAADHRQGHDPGLGAAPLLPADGNGAAGARHRPAQAARACARSARLTPRRARSAGGAGGGGALWHRPRRARAPLRGRAEPITHDVLPPGAAGGGGVVLRGIRPRGRRAPGDEHRGRGQGQPAGGPSPPTGTATT